MKTIEIVVSPTGESRLQTRGFVGPVCREASRHLERAIGLVAADQPTAEMHQHNTHQPHIDQRA